MHGGPFEIVDPEEYQRRVELAHMGVIDYVQSIDRLIAELKPEQLFLLFRMLNNFVSSEDTTGQINFLNGQIAWHLKKVHGICTGCGETAHDDAAELLGGDHSPTPTSEYMMVPRIPSGSNVPPEVIERLLRKFDEAFFGIKKDMLDDLEKMEKDRGITDTRPEGI